MGSCMGSLTGSQDENRQLKDQLNSRVAEMDQLRGDDEKVFAEKLAALQAEVNRLKSEIESLIDESSKHQKMVKEVISDQIVQLEEENSQQVKKALDQESRLAELDQQITSLTHVAKSVEMNSEKLAEETLSLVQYFSYLQSLLLSISNPAQQGNIAYQLSTDDDPETFLGIVNKVSSSFAKHKERIDQLESENKSLANTCIQEKEDIEKRMKEKSNEMIIHQQTIKQTKHTIEALQSENQKLTDQLQEAAVNARKSESEREHFKELDQLLVSREEEIERLKTEMDSFTRNFEKENENERQVILEHNEQIAKKEGVEEQTREELKGLKDQIDSLQRSLQDESEEVMRLREELSSVGNLKESSSLALQAKESEIQNLQENVAMLTSQHKDQLQEIETLKTEKDALVSEIDLLKSTCSSLESQLQKEKSELDQMLAEKNRLESEKMSACEELITKQNLISEMESCHQSQNEQLQKEKSELDQMQSEKNKLESEKMTACEELLTKQNLISEMESRHQSEKEQLAHQNEALSGKLDEIANEKKCLEDRCALLGGERDQEVSKMDAELSALRVLLKTQKEESSQKLQELEAQLQDVKTEKGLSEENAKLRDSIKKLNQTLLEVQKVSGAKQRENSNGTKSNAVSKETASIVTSASDGGQSEQNDRPLFTEETLSQRIEEIESDLAQKQEYELEVLAEKYEHDLKYARLDISQGITEDKENYERELDQKYTLKSQAVDEQGMSFFETSADKELQGCATPLPATLMLGPPALTPQRSPSGSFPPNLNNSAVQATPPPHLNHSGMQGGARARSPPNINRLAMLRYSGARGSIAASSLVSLLKVVIQPSTPDWLDFRNSVCRVSLLR